MGLRGKLRRLEQAAGAHSTELRCEVCGERMRVPQDIALRLTCAAWLKRRAERRGEQGVTEDPVVKLIEGHPHNALVNVQAGNPPGLPRGVAVHAR